jgi:hypothetical protein
LQRHHIKKRNAMLMPGNDLVDRVVGSREKVADAIAVFPRDDIPARGWAPKTADVYESVIRRIESGIGSRQVEDVTVKDCAEFIRAVTQSGRARQRFRWCLVGSCRVPHRKAGSTPTQCWPPAASSTSVSASV